MLRVNSALLSPQVSAVRDENVHFRTFFSIWPKYTYRGKRGVDKRKIRGVHTLQTPKMAIFSISIGKPKKGHKVAIFPCFFEKVEKTRFSGSPGPKIGSPGRGEKSDIFGPPGVRKCVTKFYATQKVSACLNFLCAINFCDMKK